IEPVDSRHSIPRKADQQTVTQISRIEMDSFELFIDSADVLLEDGVCISEVVNEEVVSVIKNDGLWNAESDDRPTVTTDIDNNIQLDQVTTDIDYNIQVDQFQGQLHVADKKSCYFVVCTKKDVCILKNTEG
ncbi:hypothetical protein LSTR_LSTR004666, partial [Laodelphax striatellus]